MEFEWEQMSKQVICKNLLVSKNLENEISITSFGFSGNKNSIVYCKDKGVFFGHQIEIRVGQY